jgi:hypothetical protein
MRKHTRKIAVHLSDTHGGGKLSLLDPDVVLYDEGEEGEVVPYSPQLTASQVFLWGLYQEIIALVVKLAGNDPIVVIENGDLTMGNKHPNLLVSDRLADQMIIAEANLRPWLMLDNFDGMVVTAGTGSHSFGEASSDILVTRSLQKERPDKRITFMYHGLLKVNGMSMDVSHHGPNTGARVWLRGNNARYYLRDLMTREILRGNKPPRLVLRAHYHDYVRETVRTGGYESDICINPAMTMMNDYAIQRMSSPESITVGVTVAEIIDGKLAAVYDKDFQRTLDVRTKDIL